MQALAERHRKPARPLYDPPPLENGARLMAREFLRRYEAMPEVKKAELIEGIVYVPPPVSADHSKPDSLIQTCLGTYTAAGVREYVVWRTLETGFDWFTLEDADYLAMKPDARGLLRSRVFPGLVLDVSSLLAMRSAAVLGVLRRGLASTAHKKFTASLR